MIIRQVSKKRFLVECDSCKSQIFETYKNRDLHFCSKDCTNKEKRKSGIIHQKLVASWIEKYGVENPFQNSEVKNKIKNKLIERYGVDSPAKSSLIIQRMQKTSEKRYGVNNPAKSTIIKDKIAKTKNSHTIERKFEIDQKRRITCLDRYGAETIMESVDGLHNFKQSMIKKYGVENSQQVESVRLKSRITCTKLYGVATGFQTQKNRKIVTSKETQIKKHESRKKNGTYHHSRSENRFFTELSLEFNCEIDRHVSINGWDIDFYVKSLDSYIQFDGVYYHGLDRPLEIIKKHKHPIDVTIENTYYRDIEQINWFKTNNKRLIRITDKEFQEWLREKSKKLTLKLMDLILAKS